jgi:hypothetical protein
MAAALHRKHSRWLRPAARTINGLPTFSGVRETHNATTFPAERSKFHIGFSQRLPVAREKFLPDRARANMRMNAARCFLTPIFRGAKNFALVMSISAGQRHIPRDGAAAFTRLD